MGSCCPTPDALLAPHAGAHDCHPTGGLLPHGTTNGSCRPSATAPAHGALAPCATRLGLERRWETPPDSMSAMTLTGTLTCEEECEPQVFCVVLESLGNFQILQAKLQNLTLPPCNSSPTFFHNNSQPWHVFHLLLVQLAQRSDELVDLHSHDKLSATHLQKPLTTCPNQLQRSGRCTLHQMPSGSSSATAALPLAWAPAVCTCATSRVPLLKSMAVDSVCASTCNRTRPRWVRGPSWVPVPRLCISACRTCASSHTVRRTTANQRFRSVPSRRSTATQTGSELRKSRIPASTHKQTDVPGCPADALNGTCTRNDPTWPFTKSS